MLSWFDNALKIQQSPHMCHRGCGDTVISCSCWWNLEEKLLHFSTRHHQEAMWFHKLHISLQKNKHDNHLCNHYWSHLWQDKSPASDTNTTSYPLHFSLTKWRYFYIYRELTQSSDRDDQGVSQWTQSSLCCISILFCVSIMGSELCVKKYNSTCIQSDRVLCSACMDGAVDKENWCWMDLEC